MNFIPMECVMGDDPTASALARRRSTNVSYTHMEARAGVEPAFRGLQPRALAAQPTDRE